jgi:hypothetical protein
MSTPNRHRRATAALLAGMAAIACLMPTSTRANDRDLRGTPVPAAACIQYRSSGDLGSFGGWDKFTSAFQIRSSGNGEVRLELRCPLPVNNVEISGTANDNDMTKFRLHYLDSDGAGADARLLVRLVRASTTIPNFVEGRVCEWSSNLGALAQRVVIDCPHDFESDTFYYFLVTLTVGASTPSSTFVRFWGIDFP